MLPLFLLCVVTGLACGGLAVWVARLRRELRETRRVSATHQDSGTERIGILEEANATLRRKHRSLQSRFDGLESDFLGLSYAVSHDLRAPLRSIDGFSQALAEDCGPQLDGTAQHYLERVRQAATRLNALIEALLGLGRLGRAPFEPGPVDLSGLAREAVLEITARAPDRRVEWQIQPGLTAQGDRAQLSILLRELLGNAHKFSRCRTVAHVSLRARQSPGVPPAPPEVVYEVRDDGAGYDPQFAGRLFGVFQRLHPAEEYAGCGVGLAAAQRIVRRHGGTLWAAAEPDAGAVFSFTLSVPPTGEVAQASELSGDPAGPAEEVPLASPVPKATVV